MKTMWSLNQQGLLFVVVQHNGLNEVRSSIWMIFFRGLGFGFE